MDEKETTEKRIGTGKPGPGRPKGVPNKNTTQLKDAILQAATQAGGKDGLVGYLEHQAKANPTAFLSLVGKVLPLQVTGENGGPIQHEDVSGLDVIRSRIASIAARSQEGRGAERLN